MANDPNCFPNPEEFYPERWQSKDKVEIESNNPSEYVFGFGRRQCPARKFADSNIYIVTATIIATLDISKAMDENGCELTPPHAYKSGFVK